MFHSDTLYISRLAYHFLIDIWLIIDWETNCNVHRYSHSQHINHRFKTYNYFDVKSDQSAVILNLFIHHKINQIKLRLRRMVT